MINSGISDPGECSNCPQLLKGQDKQTLWNVDTWNADFAKNTIPDSSRHANCFSALGARFPAPLLLGGSQLRLWLRMNTQEHDSSVPQLHSTKRSCGVQEGQSSTLLMGNAQLLLDKWLFPLVLNPHTIFNNLIL